MLLVRFEALLIRSFIVEVPGLATSIEDLLFLSTVVSDGVALLVREAARKCQNSHA